MAQREVQAWLDARADAMAELLEARVPDGGAPRLEEIFRLE